VAPVTKRLVESNSYGNPYNRFVNISEFYPSKIVINNGVCGILQVFL
jgi:hypothetical protein